MRNIDIIMKVENASINLIENLSKYLENTGSELYNRVQSVDFSMKVL